LKIPRNAKHFWNKKFQRNFYVSGALKFRRISMDKRGYEAKELVLIIIMLVIFAAIIFITTRALAGLR